MANIKEELDLLLQRDQKKNFQVKVPQLKLPSFLSRSTLAAEAPTNSWLKDTQDSCCPQLTRLQRIIGFVTCLGLGAFCICLSTLYIPVLILKARKFVLLYTLGSVFFILSFCFLSGFVAFLKLSFSKERRVVSAAYTCSLVATLYCALLVKSSALTVLFAVAQIIALCLMIVSTVPGGATGMRFFGQLFKSSVSSSSSTALPV